MAGKGLEMADLKEIKRLQSLGFSNRKIGKALGIHRNTVNKYLEAQNQAPVRSEKIINPNWTNSVDWEELRREYLKGVALNVLHEELFSEGKVPVQYSGFWKQAKKNLNLSEATMVRVFRPGERVEIDYSDGIDILEPATGEIRKTEFFVGVLCQSRYTFAEFTWSQKSEDFLTSHVNMFSYFGGVPQVLSPDNLKSAVTKAHRYDATINPAYTRLAAHYGVAVVPARVRTPQDKAIVERTIQIFQRWFFARVRRRTFTSLHELNKCLIEHLEIFNNKVHRIFRKTRREMFLEEVKSLRPLPTSPYEVSVYKKAILSRDCHLVFEKNYYSAPHKLRGKELDLWVSSSMIEIYFGGERVALHGRRKKGEGLYTTNTDHYPEAHAAYADEDIQSILRRSKVAGSDVDKMITVLLTGPAPYRYFRRCQGILALLVKYTREELNEACEVGNRFNQSNVKYLEGVIRMRKVVQRKPEQAIKRKENPNLRGVENIH
jgi:transposase